MKIVGGKPAESYRLYAIAGALMLGGPVWHYLYTNHYPFRQLEAVVLPLGAALAGAALLVLAHRIGGLVEALIFGAILYVFTDLQFDLEKRAIFPVILGACLAFPLLIRARRAVLTCIMLGVFYLASLPRFGPTQAPHHLTTSAGTPANPPLLVHLILDEQWGIGGLRAEGDTATAEFLADFYQRNGFEVYESAYSRWGYTVESIPEELALGKTPVFDSIHTSWPHKGTLNEIPYFQFLQSLGYTIHVYQTTILDYCASSVAVASCETEAGNSITNIASQRGSWVLRAKLAARFFLNVTSHAYVRLHPDAEAWRRSTAGGGLSALEHVRKAILATPGPGTAFFVHVLLPHRPIEIDAECAGLKDPRRRIGYEEPEHSTDSTWHATLTLIGDQIRCTHRVVGAILAAVDSVAGRDNSIVIVHGDHGSRIYQDRPKSLAASQMSARTLNARFSTLLAIRRPGVPPAVYAEPVPVQDFLWALVRQGFKGSPQEAWRHYIRASRQDTVFTDTIRTLGPGEMPWVRHPKTTGGVDSSALPP